MAQKLDLVPLSDEEEKKKKKKLDLKPLDLEPVEPSADEIISDAKLSLKPVEVFDKSIDRHIQPIKYDEAGISEPTDFWGGFRKSLKDQFLEATVGNSALQGAANIRGNDKGETLGNIAGLLLPSGIEAAVPAVKRMFGGKGKLSSIVPETVGETSNIELPKAELPNELKVESPLPRTEKPILDNSGREIAPAQELSEHGPYNTYPNKQDDIFKRMGMGLPLPENKLPNVRLKDGKYYPKTLDKETVDQIYNAGYELSGDGSIVKASAKSEGNILTSPVETRTPEFSSKPRVPKKLDIQPVDTSTGEIIEHPLDNSTDTIPMNAGLPPEKGTFNKVLNFGGTMKSLMSGPDLSGMRQGFPLIGTPEYWKATAPMIKAARSEEGFNAVQNAIRTKPNAQPSITMGNQTVSRYKAGGLKLTDLGERLSGREEEIMSHAPEDLRNAFKSSDNVIARSIRGVGNVYRGSNRAFTAYINELRSSRFDKLIDLAQKAGHDVDDPQFLKSIGSYINNATGRGSLGKFEGAAELLNTVAFSPRLAMSRLSYLNPINYANANPIVRKEMLKNIGAMSSFLLGTGELAHLAGAKFEVDPRSADFGKIRIGNTRIDMGGGFLPYIRLISQLAMHSKKNTETGKITDFNKSKFDNASTMNTLGTFARTKESPLLSLTHDWLTGEDFKGDPFRYDTALTSRVTPMIAQDIYEVSKNNPELLPITLPLSTFGANIQSYSPRVKGRKH